MSILSDLLRDVAALFFPPRCPVCGVPLAQGERTVCTLCRTTAPLTGFWRQADNPVLGRCLKESGLYDGVEVVVPLPLHPVKRCRRGYNQSEYIAEGIALQLGAEVDRRSVRRKRNTESQALKPRRERARNVDEAFAVRRPERLEGRHVLLVDDVFTTGSTMLSCAGEMLRAAPGCRISIAALAVSRRELGVRE